MQRLEVKELINVGVFTALYFVVFFATGMIGYIPILFILIPAVVPLTTGIPFMLFLTKVKKFGMLTIMATLCGLFMFLTGHTWLPLVTGIVAGFIADLILYAGKYKSFFYSVLGFSMFSLWSLGAILPLWVGILRDSYLEHIEINAGIEYAEKIGEITSDWVIPVLAILVVLMGIIGSLIGKKVLKKHFERAGIL